MVSINELVDIVEKIAGVKVRRKYNLERAQGRPRPQQQQRAHPAAPGLGAEHPARDGMEKTYAWIHDEIQSGAVVEDVLNVARDGRGWRTAVG